MPQIIVRYNYHVVNKSTLEMIDRVLSPQVLAAVNAEKPIFTLEDIEFMPEAYESGARRVPLLSIEIETMGFLDRIARMNAELPKWKAIVRSIPMVAELCIPEEKPLIWLKPVDQSGRHV